MSSQPPALPLVFGSTTFATTPQPSSTSMAVPMSSETNTSVNVISIGFPFHDFFVYLRHRGVPGVGNAIQLLVGAVSWLGPRSAWGLCLERRRELLLPQRRQALARRRLRHRPGLDKRRPRVLSPRHPNPA